MITAGIAIETVTSTIAADTVTATTTGTIDSTHSRIALRGFGDARFEISQRGQECLASG
jgi:hypothetical protein